MQDGQAELAKVTG